MKYESGKKSEHWARVIWILMNERSMWGNGNNYNYIQVDRAHISRCLRMHSDLLDRTSGKQQTKWTRKEKTTNERKSTENLKEANKKHVLWLHNIYYITKTKSNFIRCHSKNVLIFHIFNILCCLHTTFNRKIPPFFLFLLFARLPRIIQYFFCIVRTILVFFVGFSSLQRLLCRCCCCFTTLTAVATVVAVRFSLFTDFVFIILALCPVLCERRESRETRQRR